MNASELREKINEMPAIGYGIPGGIFLIALIVVGVWMFSGNDDGNNTARKQDWYYDLETKEKFAADAAQNPPILTPAQKLGDTPRGVRVHMVTCGSCSDAEIGWFEKYDEKTLKAIAGAGESADVQAGHLVRSKDGDDDKWLVSRDPKGQELTRAFYNKCPKTFKDCYPGS